MNKLTTQEILLKEKRQQILNLGIDPYPARSFETTTTVPAILKAYKEGKKADEELKIAGRIITRRVMGASAFLNLQDEGEVLQIYVNRDVICPDQDKMLYNQFFKKLIDTGDIIGVVGQLFITKTGSLALRAKSFTLLSKSLRPLPSVKTLVEEDKVTRYNVFEDPEQCYRQRYLDLLLNPETRRRFEKRAKMIQFIRRFWEDKGLLEVETPILQPIYGGASARPFTTHHHTLDIPLYLRISNELYLKRLIIGGYRGVFEFAKDFRNEGMSRFHNPEFTQIEVYVAYQDYLWMMKQTEELITNLVKKLHGSLELPVQGRVINFKTPWKKYTLYEAIKHFTGVDVAEKDKKELYQLLTQLGIKSVPNLNRAQLIDKIFGEKCEPLLIDPTFITDYPVEMSPLAKKKPGSNNLVERFELICNGKEICNAFSELNDPIDQRKRFQEQLQFFKAGDQEAMPMDEDFLRALEYGMPNAAGIGFGLDRLAMLLTNAPSIQDVLFFPQMRPL